MREISLSKRSKTFIERLPRKQQEQVSRRIMELKTNIMSGDSRKLTGFDYRRVDSGEYRIVYHFNDKTVYIIIVGKRNDSEVYKRLKNL
jgi:mRNA interferase RelE/StbE